MTKSRGINAPKHKWTPEQDAILRNQYPDMRAADVAAALGIRLTSLYARAKRLGLTKSDEFKNSSASGRLDGVRGSATRFASGHVPWTKGQKGIRLSPDTEFKRGERPVNYMAVGSEKLHMGYVWLKIADGGWPEAWRPKHHVIWERSHGAAPPVTHLLSFRDRDRNNFALDNLELISKADWMRRYTRHNLPKEIADLMALQGALTRQINKRSKAHEQ
jgi:hypothetical protein